MQKLQNRSLIIPGQWKQIGRVMREGGRSEGEADGKVERQQRREGERMRWRGRRWGEGGRKRKGARGGIITVPMGYNTIKTQVTFPMLLSRLKYSDAGRRGQKSGPAEWLSRQRHLLCKPGDLLPTPHQGGREAAPQSWPLTSRPTQ